MRAISLATVLVAIAGYAVILIASRALNPAGFETFMVYWGLFFALTGVLDGLLQETARAVTSRRNTPLQVARLATPMRTTAAFAVLFALIAAGTAPLWAPILTPGLELWGAGLLATGLLAYAFQATLCGLLSAHERWPVFAWLIAIDSMVRLLLAAVAWWAGWHLLAFVVVTVLGAVTWLGVLAISPDARGLVHQRADVPVRAFASRAAKAMVASGANAVLITGFPTLLKFTTDFSAGALAATITAVTLTRAPLLVPLQRFQPALIVYFTRNRSRVLVASARPLALVVTVAFVGALAALVVGQAVLGWFFQADYIVSAQALAWMTLASGATAVLMITGSAALAADRHGLYVAGWLVATCVAVSLLSVDASPELRSILALGVAPLVGAILQLGVLSFRRHRS